MKYIIGLLIILTALAAQAETLEQLKTRLGAAPNVVGVGEEVGTRGTYMPGVVWSSIGEQLYTVRILWVVDQGETVKKEGRDVLIFKMGDVGNEVVLGWIGDVPDPIKAAVPDAYITGRTTPFTKANVEAFCNTQYRSLTGQTNARDAIGFTVENVTPNTVRVQGLFHDATITAVQTRVRLTYLITLVDPNGAISGANVKFEKVIE